MTATVDDLFCGAGGSSLGAEHAGVRLRLGLNHWDRAIETHATNFQHADHDCADVSALTTSQIRRYITGSDLLLASPECVNHSLAKGARRRKPQAASLFDDGPAGDAEQDRSRATMWDVVRFAEQALLKGRPYKAIVVENVVDAFKWGADDDGALFSAWLCALRALGYAHEIVWLNSMFCPPSPAPVPQSRDRMYVVCWRKGIRAPNLRVEPTAWCPNCERIVAGRQTWKKPGPRVWGRYGAQYFYSCPGCHRPAHPGVFPAATIIDRSLPATRIGERERKLAENTRQRIRRGLDRLASEPFAIRLTHGGSPRPLTLPLVTLTCRHDAAMVLPVAANTFERTPGNRARDASRAPLDTVHGTADRALVVPPMSGDARPVKTTPAPTQTKTTRASLVMANTENGVPRPTGEQPAQTLRTEGALAMIRPTGHAGANQRTNDADRPTSNLTAAGDRALVVEVQRHGAVRPAERPVHTVRAGGQHHGVIVAHYDPGWARDAGQQPIGSITTRDGHSLIVPYQSACDAAPAAEQPTGTLTSSDQVALLVPGVASSESPEPEREPGRAGTGTPWRSGVLTEEDIDACLFRMFALHEIAGAMAMRHHLDGAEYVVLGNKRERMRLMGNAVTPPAMSLIVGRLLEVIG